MIKMLHLLNMIQSRKGKKIKRKLIIGKKLVNLNLQDKTRKVMLAGEYWEVEKRRLNQKKEHDKITSHSCVNSCLFSAGFL